MASNDKLIRLILQLKDEFSDQFKKVGGNLEGIGDTMQSVGKKMTASITLPLVAIGAAGVKAASDLDTSMRNIQSISKQTNAEIAALSDTFVDMSTDINVTTDTALNLANAFYDIQGSGFEGTDAMTVLTAATKAATAGLTETAIAAQGITAVLNSYGKDASEAQRISDLMFQTVNRGVGSFEELASSMSNVVGTANSIGVPFEEVSAAMATMSKQGMSFSESSVALNQAMLAFLKPSTEMEAALAAMGYESGLALVQQRGLAGAIAEVEKYTGGSADEMAGLFGNVRALRGALALTGNGAAMFAEDMAAMSNSTGAAADAFAIQTQSFEAQFKNFKNNVTAVLIEVGQIILPILNSIMQAFIPILQAFRALPDPVKQVAVGFLALLAAIGPIVWVVGTLVANFNQLRAAVTFLSNLPTLMTAIGTAGTALSGMLTTAFAGIGAALASPLLPVGLAIAAVIASLAALKAAWDKNVFGVQDKVKNAVETWGNNFKMLGDIIGLLVDKIKNKLVAIKEFGGLIIQGLIDGVKGAAGKLVEAVKTIASNVVNSIRKAFDMHSPSRVMARMGAQVTEGFTQGMEANPVGTSAITAPLLSPAAIGSGSTPLGYYNAQGGGVGGGGNVNIGAINVPPGTSQEQIQHIMREIGKQVRRRGGMS